MITKIEILKIFKKKYQNLISEKTLENYLLALEQIIDKRVIIKSKSKYLQVKSVVNKCAEIGIQLGFNPPKFSKKGDNLKKNIIDKLISQDRLITILNNCPNTANGEELKKAIIISYYSGLRLNEVLNLKTADINYNGRIKINIIGKGHKTRLVFLPLSFTYLFDDFVGFGISDKYIKGMIAKIRKKTEINFSFHSLRHSFATNMVAKGLSIYVLKELLGHSSIKTTEVYLHLNENNITEALERIGY